MQILEIPDFGGGYNDMAVDVGGLLSPTQSPNSINMDYSRIPGAACKDLGEKEIGSGSITNPLAGAVQMLYEGNIRVNNQWLNKRLVVAGGTLYYRCLGNYFVEMGTGFATGASDLIDATHYIDLFIMTDGTNPIKKWDGLTEAGFTDLTISGGGAGFATLTAKCCGVFKDYFILGNTVEDGTEYPTRYRWSNLGDPEKYEAADYNNIVTMSGDEIIRFITLYDTHIVFKKHSVHGVTWTGGSLPFDWYPIDSKVVNIAPYSIATGDLGVFFYCEEGLMVTDGMSVRELPVSMKVKDVLRRVYVDSIDGIYGMSIDPLHQYWLALPVRGSTTNNYIIIYDWKYNTWKVMEMATNVIGVMTNNESGIWKSIQDYTSGELAHLKWRDVILTGSKEVVFGKSTGYVTKRGLSFSNDGSAYNARHETGWFELAGGIKTEVMRFQPFVEGKAGTVFTIEYAVDSAPNTWISTQNYTFVQTNVVETPMIGLRKTCKKVKFRFSNDNADEFFNLYKGYIHHQPRGTR